MISGENIKNAIISKKGVWLEAKCM
ncbi:Protein of unknown function [Bacillus wiedmannii]|nr:Protein of unknown function [Bacillus wiedmannii]